MFRKRVTKFALLLTDMRIPGLLGTEAAVIKTGRNLISFNLNSDKMTQIKNGNTRVFENP
ncbi:MAG: hypothetical protein WA364_21715 [Candidatus Nitrosopolaris sp.]